MAKKNKLSRRRKEHRLDVEREKEIEERQKARRERRQRSKVGRKKEGERPEKAGHNQLCDHEMIEANNGKSGQATGQQSVFHFKHQPTPSKSIVGKRKRSNSNVLTNVNLLEFAAERGSNIPLPLKDDTGDDSNGGEEGDDFVDVMDVQGDAGDPASKRRKKKLRPYLKKRLRKISQKETKMMM